MLETHEGTDEVKRSRLNTLSQEFEIFRMQSGEYIVTLQKRFVHLKNHLIALSKTISEKKSHSTIAYISLFGKHQECELELGIVKSCNVAWFTIF